MLTAGEALHIDAVLLAKDVVHWRKAARVPGIERSVRLQRLRLARAASTRLVNLAISLEAELRRAGQEGGGSPGTSPVPKISDDVTIAA